MEKIMKKLIIILAILLFFGCEIQKIKWCDCEYAFVSIKTENVVYTAKTKERNCCYKSRIMSSGTFTDPVLYRILKSEKCKVK